MTGHIDMREAWNRISQDYQQTNKIPAAVVHYGPHCPNEDQLCLIGEVRGKRVLRPAGLFVFSWDHPFWDCLKVEEMRLRRSYHDRTPQDWDWEYQGGSVCARMRSYSRTVSDWFHLLRGAGLEVLDVLEPEPVESGSGQDDFGGDDFYAPARQRMVPATIIWKARKP